MSALHDKVKDLATITGCLGGFVARGGACVASGLPAVYDHERLSRVAAQLRKLSALADKSGYASSDFVLAFGKATLLVLSLGDGTHLVLACEPGASLATVEMFASVAADDIREALASWTPAPEVELTPLAPLVSPDPPVVAAPVVAPTPVALPKPDPRVVLEEGRRLAAATLGARLTTVRALLIAEVGPIGDILFNQALDEWLLGGPVSWSRCPTLRARLAAEIDNPGERTKFENHAVWR